MCPIEARLDLCSPCNVAALSMWRFSGARWVADRGLRMQACFILSLNLELVPHWVHRQRTAFILSLSSATDRRCSMLRAIEPRTTSGKHARPRSLTFVVLQPEVWNTPIAQRGSLTVQLHAGIPPSETSLVAVRCPGNQLLRRLSLRARDVVSGGGESPDGWHNLRAWRLENAA